MKLNFYLVGCAVVAALGGFLFGFDTVVISGAEQKIQSLWNLSAGMQGFAVASALYGTVLGSLLGCWPTDFFGRKKTLLMIGVLYLISAVGCAFSPNVYVLIAARVIGGLGIGISTVAAPLYISEIAPPAFRGRLAGMFQFNIVFGILVAYLSNELLSGIGENAWRWMLGVAAFPSLIYALLCLGIPESPRWLIARKGNLKAGMDVLKLIDPSASSEQIQARANEILAASSAQKSSENFWIWLKSVIKNTWQLRFPIALAFLIAFFNQLSGINAVLYFAPRIFELTGMGAKAALLQSIGIGITNLIFTFVGLSLIDRLGRRTLLFIGSFGYIISLGLVAWAFFTQHYSIVPVCIFAFIAAHAVGQGAVIWVFISEIFPNRFRAKGQTWGCFTHWIFAALLTTVFPIAISRIAPTPDYYPRAGWVFLFFCGMMVLQLVWVKFMVPETKGVSLEQIQQKLGIE
jgi:SP family arabinose:H+ symporter-like MFS transporter